MKTLLFCLGLLLITPLSNISGATPEVKCQKNGEPYSLIACTDGGGPCRKWQARSGFYKLTGEYEEDLKICEQQTAANQRKHFTMGHAVYYFMWATSSSSPTSGASSIQSLIPKYGSIRVSNFCKYLVAELSCENQCPANKNGKRSKTCTMSNAENVTRNTCCDGLKWNSQTKRCEAPIEGVGVASNFKVPQCINTSEGKEFLKTVQVAEDKLDAAVNFFTKEVTSSTNRIHTSLSSFKNMNQVIYNALNKRQSKAQDAYESYKARIAEIQSYVNILAHKAGLLPEERVVEQVEIPSSSPFFNAEYQQATVLSVEEGEKAKAKLYQDLANVHNDLDGELKEAQQRGADHVWYCAHEKECSERIWEIKSGTKLVEAYHDPFHSLKAPIAAKRGAQIVSKTAVNNVFSFLKNHSIYQTTFDFDKTKRLPQAGGYISALAKEYSITSKYLCIEKPGKEIMIPQGKQTVVKKLRRNAQTLAVYYKNFHDLMNKQSECLAGVGGQSPVFVLSSSVASLGSVNQDEFVEREDQSLDESVSINLNGNENGASARGQLVQAFDSQVGSVSSQGQSNNENSNGVSNNQQLLSDFNTGKFAIKSPTQKIQRSDLKTRDTSRPQASAPANTLLKGEQAQLETNDNQATDKALSLAAAKAEGSSKPKSVAKQFNPNSQKDSKTQNTSGSSQQKGHVAIDIPSQFDFDESSQASNPTFPTKATQAVSVESMGASGAKENTGVLNLNKNDYSRNEYDDLFGIITKTYMRQYPQLLSR